MRRFYGLLENEIFTISGDENNHLKNVLRLNVNDEIICFNGDGKEYVCVIENISKNETKAKVLDVAVCKANPNKDITLFLATCKKEKLELILQKSVELGAKQVVIFPSEYSVAKIESSKLARLNSIVISALKQCERCDFLEVVILNSFDEMLKCLSAFDAVYFAYEREENDAKMKINGQKLALIVGAEGGFSCKEHDKILKAGAQSISLGKRILRCETAGVVLLGIVSYLSGN